MESSADSVLEGHPWSKDVQARFHYLMCLLDHSREELEPKTLTKQRGASVLTGELSMAIQRLLTAFDVVLENPKHPLDSQIWSCKPNQINLIQLENELTSRLSSADLSTLETTLCTFFSSLALDTEGGTLCGSQILQFICQVILKFHVSHTNKPLPANLVHIVDDMLSSPNCKFFVLDKLIPTVVLVTGHRQCSFIINLIAKLSFDDKSRLLHTLCNGTGSWPLETFPILQSLLDTGVNPELWTAAMRSSICRAFSEQVQRNASLNSSPQFASLLMHFVRQHGPALTDESSRDLLIQVAERHNTFLRGPLMNSITSCKTTTQ